jgi:CheY-like chemotaxis protein
VAKILVVDDTEEHLFMFSMLLKQQQHKVETAMSADKALAFVESFKPDIILIDVLLGNYSGRVLCKQIRNRHPDIHMVIISANAEVLEDYGDCGAEGAIEKPFDIITVYNTIDRLIPAY